MFRKNKYQKQSYMTFNMDDFQTISMYENLFVIIIIDIIIVIIIIRKLFVYNIVKINYQINVF